LRSANWPHISYELKLFLARAASAGIQCFIPEPVLRELEENWKRDVTTDEGHARRLNLRYAPLGLPSAEPPSSKRLLSGYRTAVTTLLNDTGAGMSPLTTRPAGDLFERSVSRDLTFTADKDGGFQDCVILLSVLDHLEKDEPAVLVSRDAAFSNEACLAHIAKTGLDLRVVKNLSDVSQLVEDASAHVSRLRVSAQLDKRLDALSTYATEELVTARAQFEGGSPEDVGVNRVRLLRVDEVQVGKGEKDGTVAISARFKAELELFAQTNRLTWAKTTGAWFAVPLQFEDTATADIGMDLEASQDDREFEHMQPKAIYVKHVYPLKPLPAGQG
jgi:hypothetical protein